MFFSPRNEKVREADRQSRRKYPILGETTDVDGAHWYVRQIRETKHGFDLLLGSPISHAEPLPTRLPRLIPTQPLKDFWEANKTKRDRTVYDLPAGRTTIKRVRRRLGFDVTKDVSKFWQLRIDDLRTLSARAFSERHNVDVNVVFDTRRRLLGKSARELGWWREPRVLNILLSRITLAEAAKKLGIGTSHACRLRRRAHQEHKPDHVRPA